MLLSSECDVADRVARLSERHTADVFGAAVAVLLRGDVDLLEGEALVGDDPDRLLAEVGRARRVAKPGDEVSDVVVVHGSILSLLRFERSPTLRAEDIDIFRPKVLGALSHRIDDTRIDPVRCQVLTSIPVVGNSGLEV